MYALLRGSGSSFLIWLDAFDFSGVDFFFFNDSAASGTRPCFVFGHSCLLPFLSVLTDHEARGGMRFSALD